MNAATLKHVKYVATENPVTLMAFILFIGFVLLALFGPWIAPYDALASNTEVALKPPTAAHWFGTDSLGRDILSRIVVAARLDFGIAVSAVAVSFALGAALGALAGFYGGWADRIIGRVADTIMAFPLFVLAAAIINFPLYARVARAETLMRREAGFVDAVRLSGHRDIALVLGQVAPNIMPIMVMQMSIIMGDAILSADRRRQPR